MRTNRDTIGQHPFGHRTRLSPFRFEASATRHGLNHEGQSNLFGQIRLNLNLGGLVFPLAIDYTARTHAAGSAVEEWDKGGGKGGMEREHRVPDRMESGEKLREIDLRVYFTSELIVLGFL